MPLSLGLNLKKKPLSSPRPSNKPSVFAPDSESDTELPTPKSKPKQNGTKHNGTKSTPTAASTTEISTFDSEAPQSKKSPSRSSHSPCHSTSPPETNNSILPSTDIDAYRTVTSLQETDPDIFDYDAHFNTSSSTAQAAARKLASKREAQERKPKYVTGMQSAALQRKRDHLRAEDKKLQREREEEGENETESFVTEAYKERQAEARRLEEEELKKEKDEEGKRKGMGGFWRGVWDEQDKAREAPPEVGVESGVPLGDEVDKDREAAELAKKLNQAGGNVVINDEGQVADKRQLLNAGLNIAKRGDGVNSVPERERKLGGKDEGERNEWDTKEKKEARRAMGERHAKMVEQQMEAAKKRKAEEDAAEVEKREAASKSQKTQKDISSAKERYLQRKREAEERKKAGIED